MQFEFGVYDAGVIAVVMALVGTIKQYILPRFIPLLPLGFGFLAGILMYFTGQLEIAPGGTVAGQVIWNGFLYAAISGILFKTYKTTVRGS